LKATEKDSKLTIKSKKCRDLKNGKTTKSHKSGLRECRKNNRYYSSKNSWKRRTQLKKLKSRLLKKSSKEQLIFRGNKLSSRYRMRDTSYSINFKGKRKIDNA
jgi:hypothetical protein